MAANPGSPRIAAFVAEPATINQGSTSTLRWSVSGATQVEISPITTVPNLSNGTLGVSPVTTLIYTLAATNAAGTSVARVKVVVNRTTAAKVVHVSTLGVDSAGRGTAQAPYRSPQYAIDRANPGDTVEIHEGTYDGSLRIRATGITLRSSPGARAIIRASLTQSGETEAVLIDTDAHGARLERLEITGGYYYGIMLQTKWDYGNAAERFGAGHVVIADCYIHDTGRDAIKVTPGVNDLTVLRSTIRNSGRRDSSNAEGLDSVNADRLTVLNTWIDAAATNGIYFKGGSIGSRIERSLVTNSGGGGILLGFDTSPEFFDTTVNPGFYECLDCIARNNIVIGSNMAGVGLYSSLRSQVLHNTVMDGGRQAGAHSAGIHFGVVLHDLAPGIPVPPNREPLLANNLVQLSSAITSPMISIRYTSEHGEDGVSGGIRGLAGSAVFLTNRYFHVGKRARFVDNRPGLVMDGNLATWITRMSTDLASTEGEPLLGTGYFPRSGSPLVGAATGGYALDSDYHGNPRGDSADIGACQANGTRAWSVPPAATAIGTLN